ISDTFWVSSSSRKSPGSSTIRKALYIVSVLDILSTRMNCYNDSILRYKMWPLCCTQEIIEIDVRNISINARLIHERTILWNAFHCILVIHSFCIIQLILTKYIHAFCIFYLKLYGINNNSYKTELFAVILYLFSNHFIVFFFNTVYLLVPSVSPCCDFTEDCYLLQVFFDVLQVTEETSSIRISEILVFSILRGLLRFWFRYLCIV
ncbi:hypothetical protein L9F63_018363, partial [Diploptera punctata]